MRMRGSHKAHVEKQITNWNPSLTENHYLVEEIMVLIIMTVYEIYLTG